MSGFINQMFIVLVLILCFGRSLIINCISINDQHCIARPTLIDLNLDKLHYSPFIISMNKCPFGRICVPNKVKDMNLNVFDMIKRINETKTLAKHISCKYRYEFDGQKCNSR